MGNRGRTRASPAALSRRIVQRERRTTPQRQRRHRRRDRPLTTWPRDRRFGGRDRRPGERPTTAPEQPDARPSSPSTPADAATVAAIESALASARRTGAIRSTRGSASCRSRATRSSSTTRRRRAGIGWRFPPRRSPPMRRASPSTRHGGISEDGFSANASLLTYVADLDPTNLPTWTDLGASLDDDATVVLVDTSTGDRVPLWAEPDAGADDPDGTAARDPPGDQPRTRDHVRRRPAGSAAPPPGNRSPCHPCSPRTATDLTTDIDAIESRREAMEATIEALRSRRRRRVTISNSRGRSRPPAPRTRRRRS